MCLGIPGEILDVRDDKGLRVGKVRFAGITREVCLQYVPEAAAGDFVVVHVGFAISKIDPEEAERAYRVLEDLGQTGELTADAAASETGREVPRRIP
ncbi:MAG TPA: HypC/HybG/HupF family hydrogenase formation chaperone [Candidatus Binataceae bacterium]|nr:HypC/HybG/HupF family hydrogenase formation chaperone [Candidatus Binataceae bacterium]